MRHHLFASVALLSASACFVETEPDSSQETDQTETTDATGDGDGDPSGDGDGDASGDGDGDDSGDGDGDPGPQDAPPNAENMAIDGSASPPKLLQSKVLSLSVDASDDLGIESVEFFEDGNSIGFGELAPLSDTSYALEYVVSGETFDGQHAYTATVTDTSAQSTEAGPVSLEIDVPASGTESWSQFINPTSSQDEVADCLVTGEGQLVLAGRASARGMLSFLNAASGTLMDTEYIGEDGEYWEVAEVEPGAENSGFVTAIVQRGGPNNHISVQRRLEGGGIAWDTGVLRSNGDENVYAGGMATTSDLVYLGYSPNNAPFELIILDMQGGEELCSVEPSAFDVEEMLPLEGGDVMLVGDAGDAWVGRYNSNCEEVWSVETLDGRYYDGWQTQSGTIYVAGYISNQDTGFDGLLREVAIDGTLGPTHEFDGGAGGYEVWFSVAETPAGNVILAGQAGNFGDIHIRAESSPGELVWDAFPADGGGIDSARQICMDRAGNTFVVGRFIDAGDVNIWAGRFAP